MPTCQELKEIAFLSILKHQPFFFYWLSQLRYEEMPTGTARIQYLPHKNESWLRLCPAFVEPLPVPKVIGLVAHELMHYVHEHPMSENIRDPHWNIATDLAVNTLLLAQGYDLPTGADYSEDWEPILPGIVAHTLSLELGRPVAPPPPLMSAAWYYQWIKQQYAQQQQQQQPSCGGQNGNGDDSGSGDLDSGSPGVHGSERDLRPDAGEGNADNNDPGSEPADPDVGDDHRDAVNGADLTAGAGQPSRPTLADLAHDHGWEELTPEEESLVKQMVARQVEEALQQAAPPGDMAGTLQGLLRVLEPPKINWREQLRKFVGYCGSLQIDVGRNRLNKHGMPPKVMLKPKTKLLVFIDTSGSVSKRERQAFFAELEGLLKHRAEFDVAMFDTKMQGDPKPFKKADQYEDAGGGGTDFNVPFRWLRDSKSRRNYNGVIIMTDAECWWPDPELVQGLKTLWVITRKPLQALPEHISNPIYLELK